jgi:HEAT repeat protein
MLTTLLRFGQEARAALPGIRACLDGHGELEAEPALHLLFRLGPPGVKVFDAYLRDSSTRHGFGMIMAVGEIGPGARCMIPTLIGFLKEDDLSTRLAAAQSLLRLDRPLAVRLIVPVLVDAL